MNIDTLLMSHRLHIDNYYENIALLFCNTVGSKSTETKARFLLSNWYEGYLFTLLLGIKINQRVERKGDRSDKAPGWSPNYLEQYKYAITKLVVRKDILNELNLLSRDSIRNHFENVEVTLRELKKICDEYANGGLEYLKGLYEKDDTIFNDYKSLREIFANAKPESINT